MRHQGPNPISRRRSRVGERVHAGGLLKSLQNPDEARPQGGRMAFQSREEYEAWKRRAGTPAPANPAAPVGSTPPVAVSPGDIELRLSPLYGGIVAAAGAIFTVMGIGRFGKAGPTFYTFCLVVGLAAILIGVWMLRRRGVIVRMTASALHLQGAVIPWAETRSLERVLERRNYWIGVHLKTPRTDLDGIARKAQAALRAMGSRCADFDYTLLETDLPRSGPWFIEECERRMAAAGPK